MIRNVAVLIDTSEAWNRDNIAGIVKAVRGVYPWRLMLSPRDHLYRPRVPTNWQCDGLITSIRDTATSEHVRSLNRPVVNLTSWGRDLDWAGRVLTDDRIRAKLAYEHFREKGYRRFAYFAPLIRRNLRHRGEAFKELVQSQGFDFREFPGGDGQNDAELLSPEEWIRSLEYPVAILAGNPHPALQLTDICAQIGIRVPQEVAILSCDNDELLCEISDPPISAIELPATVSGAKAAEYLHELMEGITNDLTIRWVEPMGIIERRSTSALAIGDPLFEEAVNYLRSHAPFGIHVSDVVKKISISRRLLEQKFASVLGVSPAAEIRRVRIAHIKQLLTNSQLSIRDISEQTGFSTPARLSELFRNEVGMSPNEYRDEFS